MPYTTTTTTLSATHLRIVRFAMLAGMLLFLGFAQMSRSNRAADGVSPDTNLAMIRLVGFGMAAMALVAIAVIRGVRQRAPVEKRGTYGLIGSAFGEGAGFLGLVYFFLGGDLAVFAAALVAFLASWVMLPADPEAV